MKIEKDEFGALNVEKFSALFETAYTHFTTHKTSPYYAEFFRVPPSGRIFLSFCVLISIFWCR
jgi:hypothetical protein